MLVMAVWGMSVGGNGQWSDRREQPSSPINFAPQEPAPGGAVAPRSTGWAGNGPANGAQPGTGLWPAAGADSQYRAIDACRYDEELQRKHDLILCEGHRVLWRFGEQLRQEAIDYARWSAAGGVVGRTVRTVLKSARQTARIGHNAHNVAKGTIPCAGGVIRQFEQPGTRIYYRVFSGDATTGRWLISVAPRSRAWAQEALALPPWNKATHIQEVVVPEGTLLERSRAIPVPEWGRLRGGAEQFKLLEVIPEANFGPGRPLS